MNSVTWMVAEYTITSFGNGLAYSILDDQLREVFYQGDEALDWRDGYDNADAQCYADTRELRDYLRQTFQANF